MYSQDENGVFQNKKIFIKSWICLASFNVSDGTFYSCTKKDVIILKINKDFFTHGNKWFIYVVIMLIFYTTVGGVILMPLKVGSMNKQKQTTTVCVAYQARQGWGWVILQHGGFLSVSEPVFSLTVLVTPMLASADDWHSVDKATRQRPRSHSRPGRGPSCQTCALFEPMLGA